MTKPAPTPHPAPPRPRWPWFKDERVLRGHVTMRFSVRWILLVILGALALLIVAALFVIGEVQRIDALTVANKDRAVTGQAQRAQDEQAAAAREDAKVAQLACSLVSLVEVGKNPQIDQLRLRYNCTPTAAGTPTAEGQPSSLPTSPRPTGPSAPTPSPGPSR